MPFVLKPIILFISAVILLRITGRRSISQMTIAQTVVIISMGAMIVEPFADKSVFKTVVAAVIYIVLLIIFEYFEYHSNKFEKLFVGKSVLVIQDGKVILENMKKLKITATELDSRLRQEGIKRISDIKRGTLEYNGELGYELRKGASPLTVDDMEFIINRILNDKDSNKRINLVEELNKKVDKKDSVM